VEGRLAAHAPPAGTNTGSRSATAFQPTESDFIDIVPFGATRTTPLQGVLATITAADIPAPTADQIASAPERKLVRTSLAEPGAACVAHRSRDRPDDRHSDQTSGTWSAGDPVRGAGMSQR